ncbi:MAG: pepsin/retropepsin-like aspartic protease family protein [Rhizomicrobium sp.]
MNVPRLALAGLTLSLLGTAPAMAESRLCQMPLEASLDMTTEADGEVSVPVTVSGLAGQMLIDTGGVQTILGRTVARRLALGIQPSANTYMLFGGVRLQELATAHELILGRLKAKEIPLLLAPPASLHNDDIGILAPDIMSNYDVELDFAAGKFNLFQHFSCSGTPVYWTKEPVATVPFKHDFEDHIMISIALDGQEVTAGVDTGADRSTMTLAAFRELFGKGPDEPALSVVGKISINGTRAMRIFRYSFQALNFEGIRVQKPNIDIVETDRLDDRAPKIILGVETLRQLHMYIAYDARKIYFTAAEAR